MPQRGLVLVLALATGALGGACRKPTTPVEQPEDAPIAVVDEEVDAPGVCSAGCDRLERCVPELVGEIDGDPTVIADRLGQECDSACATFEDRGSSLALRDCLNLDSCNAYWGCVGTATVRPWLAAVAPVGERTCENLCSQASACAIAKVCETEAGGRKTRPGKAGADAGEDEQVIDPECMRDDVRRSELDETCLLSCEATPVDSPARTELIGCIDHASCDGMLSCLDSWAETDYGDASGPTPGISPTCDAFCTRAIVCGAEQENVELEPEELEELKQVMTSTYVECAVQCGKDLAPGDEAARAAFDACAAVETCEAFTTCANEV
ncbi:hypothetical protein ENSA5_47980 [Enhygromyxa salina]|uniref:Uncharacterized protein n=1 Tax=Enhygromyxa salina TaxID=215803 RepID=A0A2S9XIF6_9BACT|nr:hypothetical protein [Enhygromyxa salina]PRP92617.1 hypothetical protein ENSA5_47980 [Enhygromyxa salina]